MRAPISSAAPIRPQKFNDALTGRYSIRLGSLNKQKTLMCRWLNHVVHTIDGRVFAFRSDCPNYRRCWTCTVVEDDPLRPQHPCYKRSKRQGSISSLLPRIATYRSNNCWFRSPTARLFRKEFISTAGNGAVIFSKPSIETMFTPVLLKTWLRLEQSIKRMIDETFENFIE